MNTYTLLSASVGGILLFLAIAFFKHKADINSHLSELSTLKDGKVKLEIENRELVQKVADLQRINVEQQAKIAEYENRQAFLKNYPVDKITGIPKDSVTGIFVCPICLQEFPPKAMTLQEDEKAWWCPKSPNQHFFQWKSQS